MVVVEGWSRKCLIGDMLNFELTVMRDSDYTE